MNVVLIGYMGSGKSVIGRELASVLTGNFIDLDDYIELEEGTSISELFEKKGEVYFRKLESEKLREILENKNHVVLATGGGTPCYGDNMDRIKLSDSVSIYLKTSVTELAWRLFEEKEHRPLIRDLNSEDISEFIAKHLFERNLFYSQANFTVETDKKTISDIIREIVALLFQ